MSYERYADFTQVNGATVNAAYDEIASLKQQLAEAQRENEEVMRQKAYQYQRAKKAEEELATLRQQLAEANLAYKNIQNGILIKEANLNYFAEQNKQLKKLLREASGPMSYGHWSSDFRNKVKEALK